MLLCQGSPEDRDARGGQPFVWSLGLYLKTSFCIVKVRLQVGMQGGRAP